MPFRHSLVLLTAVNADSSLARRVPVTSVQPATSRVYTMSHADQQGGPSARTRILLADDNPAILAHASDALRAEYDIVGQIATCDVLYREVAAQKPSVVVLDISMGTCSGIEVARRLVEQGYAGEFVFLTMHEDADLAAAAIGAGGRGYVVKSRMDADLPLAIRAVLAHRIFISSALQHS
jgi:DNA-binding NarL/FixJ family response regulator